MTTQDEPPGEAAVGARRVVLARYRTGNPGSGNREVHLLPLPVGGNGGAKGAASAMCGTSLRPAEIETVAPGDGEWCTLCFLAHVTGRRQPPLRDVTGTGPMAECRSAAAVYRKLGWPITLRGSDVSLGLDPLDAVALVIPATLSSEAARILVQRRSPPPLLAHPGLPSHRIILAGERSSVPLVWPTGVHRVTGTLPLPPTSTSYGPVRWVRPPQPHALKLCREVDVLLALSAALSNPPYAASPTHF